MKAIRVEAWGYGGWSGEVAIVIDGSREVYARYFDEVTQAATIPCRRCMGYERDLPVFVVRRLRTSLEEYWAAERFLLEQRSSQRHGTLWGPRRVSLGRSSQPPR